MVDMPEKTTHFRHAARWRSGYAEDCKSTDTARISLKVRTIRGLFTPRNSVCFKHYCELSRCREMLLTGAAA